VKEEDDEEDMIEEEEEKVETIKVESVKATVISHI
jgi:hypothetical protein